MYIWVLLAPILFLLLVKCQNEKVSLKYDKTSDSLMLKNESIMFFSYYDKETKADYYTSFRQGILSIQNLKTNEMDSVIFPESILNSDSFGEINSYFVHSLDSIFFLQEYRVFLSDKNGQIFFEKPINQQEEEEQVFYHNSASAYPIIYYPESNTINLRRLNMKTNRFDKAYFDLKPDAYFSMESDSTFIGEITFPSNFKKECWGDIHNYYKTTNNKLNVFSFEADENLYVEDLSTKRIRKIACKSRFQKNRILPFDPKDSEESNMIFDYINVSQVYLKIMYDPFKNLYYRFFWKENKIKDDKGNYTVYVDKELVLMVLDEDFNILDELDLKNEYHWFQSFVTSKGICIFKKNQPPKSTKEYGIFSFTQ